MVDSNFHHPPYEPPSLSTTHFGVEKRERVGEGEGERDLSLIHLRDLRIMDLRPFRGGVWSVTSSIYGPLVNALGAAAW